MESENIKRLLEENFRKKDIVFGAVDVVVWTERALTLKFLKELIEYCQDEDYNFYIDGSLSHQHIKLNIFPIN